MPHTRFTDPAYENGQSFTVTLPASTSSQMPDAGQFGSSTGTSGTVDVSLKWLPEVWRSTKNTSRLPQASSTSTRPTTVTLLPCEDSTLESATYLATSPASSSSCLNFFFLDLAACTPPKSITSSPLMNTQMSSSPPTPM